MKKRKKRRRKRRRKKGKNKEINEKEYEETSILSDFSACMFEYEEIAEFESNFNLIRQKVSKQIWLDSIYKLKKNGLHVI